MQIPQFRTSISQRHSHYVEVVAFCYSEGENAHRCRYAIPVLTGCSMMHSWVFQSYPSRTSMETYIRHRPLEHFVTPFPIIVVLFLQTEQKLQQKTHKITGFSLIVHIAILKDSKVQGLQIPRRLVFRVSRWQQ